MKTIPVIFRQGDVILRRIDKLPDNLKPIKRKKGRVILAEGEVSGHHHAIEDNGVQHFAAPDAGVTMLEVREAMALLTHDEHAPIKLPKGNYEVRIAREYHPQEIRTVRD